MFAKGPPAIGHKNRCSPTSRPDQISIAAIEIQYCNDYQPLTSMTALTQSIIPGDLRCETALVAAAPIRKHTHVDMMDYLITENCVATAITQVTVEDSLRFIRRSRTKILLD